ncbi:MAG TPA: hypothetical protein ENI23_15430 [bacterium]|nr:hypothetical protein [bacterium]
MMKKENYLYLCLPPALGLFIFGFVLMILPGVVGLDPIKGLHVIAWMAALAFIIIGSFLEAGSLIINKIIFRGR